MAHGQLHAPHIFFEFSIFAGKILTLPYLFTLFSLAILKIG